MAETDFSKTIRRYAEVLCLIFSIAMSTVFIFYLSNGNRKAGTDKGILYIYLGGIFFVLGMILSLAYYLGNVKNIDIKAALTNLSISDRFMLAYLLALFISFLASPNAESKLWGVAGWYQGFLPNLFMVGSYFVISRFCSNAKGSVMVLSAASALEGIIVIANRFGIYPPDFQGISDLYAGTLGNVNWYCGYWSVFFPLILGIYLMLPRGERKTKVFFGICLGINSLSGVIQGSDSAIIVLLFVLTAVLLLFYRSDKTGRLRYARSLIIISAPLAALYIILDLTDLRLSYEAEIIDLFLYRPVSLALFFAAVLLYLVIKTVKDRESERLLHLIKNIFIVLWPLCIIGGLILLIMNTVSYGSIGPLSENSLFYADYNWGNFRGYTLFAGAGIFKDADILHKILGWGPDSFCYAVYRGGSSVSDIVISKFGDSKLTNAHCEPLTLLCNLGILGLVSYEGMLISRFAGFIKKHSLLSIACALSILGYMANNLVSFAQPANITFLFIIIGLGSTGTGWDALTKEEP